MKGETQSEADLPIVAQPGLRDINLEDSLTWSWMHSPHPTSSYPLHDNLLHGVTHSCIVRRVLNAESLRACGRQQRPRKIYSVPAKDAGADRSGSTACMFPTMSGCFNRPQNYLKINDTNS